MVQVTVTPEVTTGVNRGGEDLHLLVSVEFEGSTPPVNDEFEVKAYAFDGEGYSQENQDDNEEPYQLKRVHYCTDHYEFEWEGEGKDVLGLTTYCGRERVTVEQYLRNPENWRFCHKPSEPPRLVCETSVYVNGNAD